MKSHSRALETFQNIVTALKQIEPIRIMYVLFSYSILKKIYTYSNNSQGL